MYLSLSLEFLRRTIYVASTRGYNYLESITNNTITVKDFIDGDIIDQHNYYKVILRNYKRLHIACINFSNNKSILSNRVVVM